MPVYNGTNKVKLSGIAKAYVGNNQVFSSASWHIVFEGSQTINPGNVTASSTNKNPPDTTITWSPDWEELTFSKIRITASDTGGGSVTDAEFNADDIQHQIIATIENVTGVSVGTKYIWLNYDGNKTFTIIKRTRFISGSKNIANTFTTTITKVEVFY